MALLAQTPNFVASFIDVLIDRWYYATATDFGILALGVVVACWYVSRYCSD